jgi:hypothetical protein
MPKLLKDILAGVKSSKVTPGSVGKNPHVDYEPKAPAEQNWIKTHSIEKHDDRVGNGPEVYQGSTVKYSMDTAQMKNYGYPSGKDEEVYGEEVVNEVITKKTSAAEIIKDFINSDDPRFKGKSAKERQRMALGAYYSMHKEDIAQPLLGGDIAKNKTDDTQDEIEMVRAELKAIANKAMHILASMPKDMHVEPWVQAKIAQAKGMISGVHDHMVYGKENEESDSPMVSPGMDSSTAGDQTPSMTSDFGRVV